MALNLFVGLKGRFEVGEKQNIELNFHSPIAHRKLSVLKIYRRTTRRYYIESMVNDTNTNYNDEMYANDLFDTRSFTYNNQTRISKEMKKKCIALAQKSEYFGLRIGDMTSSVHGICAFIMFGGRGYDIYADSKMRFDMLVKLINELTEFYQEIITTEQLPCIICGNICEHGEEYCTTCKENGIVKCECCSDNVSASDIVETPRGKMCKRCADSRYNMCPDCNRFVSKRTRCECGSDRMLLGYSYKPNPIFFWNEKEVAPITYGVEIETELPNNLKSNEAVLSVYKHRHFYFKEDGSLSNGIEFVSHPCSIEYHRENTLKMLATLRDKNLSSDTTTTCGLHVHVGKDNLGRTDLEIKENTMKVLMITDLLWKDLIVFTRRSKDKLEHWANCYQEEAFKMAKSSGKSMFDLLFADDKENILNEAYKRIVENNSAGRYRSVNIGLSKTIEFRVFRGTIKDTEFMASLQLVDLIIEFAKTSDIKEIIKLKRLRDIVDIFTKKNRKKYSDIALYMDRIFPIED